MRTAEKNNWKQESIDLPSSIKWVVKIVATVAWFYLWGVDFIWVVLGWSVIVSILRGILSCLFSMTVLIGVISFLINHIF